ncbi:LamG-like jellyroll fold domain-containing protein [Streptomyces sp. NPDC053367]|uniref:LamG-like jellyroll fold domain-containing protein n=1 Tax=Streptomyces sp. NPDC053367 TaxID=3365700 RepID=UPI0037D04C1D
MSMRADQASDRVSYTASAPPAPATAFTVTFWARLRVDRDDFSTMLRLHSSSGGSTSVNIATGSSGTTPVVVSPGNTGGIVGADPLAVDTWRMLAVTVAGTGATDGKIYTRTVGGSTSVVSGLVSGGGTPDGITLFGRSAGDATEWFNGGLAYVRVWSAVLSQAEIEAEWASATIVRTSGVWANWPMLTDINDISGNARHLSAGSTALTVEDNPPLSTTVTGTALGTFGSLTGAASGVRTASGTAAASLGGLTGAAVGTRKVTGSGALSGGALTGTASDSAAATPASGSWYGLLDILREGAQQYREEQQRPPEACLDCGEPLRTSPRGELFCRFDGSIWAAGGRLVGHVSTAGRR